MIISHLEGCSKWLTAITAPTPNYACNCAHSRKKNLWLWCFKFPLLSSSIVFLSFINPEKRCFNVWSGSVCRQIFTRHRVYNWAVGLHIHWLLDGIVQKIFWMLLGLVYCRYGMYATNASHVPSSTILVLFPK